MGNGDSIILTGFMGVGKSAVGRAVAERLGRPFVDMDERIEAGAGKSISRIFEEDGEDAFRAAERRLCEELAENDGLIIATGGGALIDEANRRLMAEAGEIVCLTCETDEILRRLEGAPDRPLIEGVPRREAIEHAPAARQAMKGPTQETATKPALPTPCLQPHRRSASAQLTIPPRTARRIPSRSWPKGQSSQSPRFWTPARPGRPAARRSIS